MREFLTNLGVGVGLVAGVAGVLLVVSIVGAFAIALVAAPGTPPPDFRTQIAIGIVMLLGVGIAYSLGRLIREVFES